MSSVAYTELPLNLWRRGKVRDVYDLGAHLLFVASDRISAFDWVLPNGIPDKGKVLTQLSLFWFGVLGELVPTHLAGADPAADPRVPARYRAVLAGRAMVVEKAEVFPVECVARGYLAGSGWKDYQRTGAVCGIGLPVGLRESERLPEPLFTPSTKAGQGAHDENIGLDEAARLIGAELAERVRDIALALYRFGASVAEPAGIILADTKFEFGVDPKTRELLLIDEVLTPDSSRFWDAATYERGRPAASFDKQFVRDWLEGQSWDKTAPGPELPADIVDGTRARYVEAFERITGASFDRYLAEDTIVR
jgi:phosphoribosylaminoimidazole-succinocarboxamide synthase